MQAKVFAAVTCLALSQIAFGQTLAVKSGLWETRSVDDDGTVSKSRECITAEQLKQQLARLQSRPDCKAAFSTATSKQTVFDVSCQIKSTTVKTHAEQEAIDSEHIRSTITATIIRNGTPNVSAMKGDAHFISASCGNVKPGEPEDLP